MAGFWQTKKKDREGPFLWATTNRAQTKTPIITDRRFC
jgi:hypothetical protein